MLKEHLSIKVDSQPLAQNLSKSGLVNFIHCKSSGTKVSTPRFQEIESPWRTSIGRRPRGRKEARRLFLIRQKLKRTGQRASQLLFLTFETFCCRVRIRTCSADQFLKRRVFPDTAITHDTYCRKHTSGIATITNIIVIKHQIYFNQINKRDSLIY